MNDLRIRCPTNFYFVRWLFVLGIVLLSFLSFPNTANATVVPLNADVTDYTYFSYSAPLISIDEGTEIFLEGNGARGLSFTIPEKYFSESSVVTCYLCMDYDSPTNISLMQPIVFTATEEDTFFFYVDGSSVAGSYGDGLKNRGCFVKNHIDNWLSDNGRNTWYTYVNGFYLKIADYEGEELILEGDAFETQYDVDDVNTYPVGHIEIVEPSGTLNVNYSNKHDAYPVDVRVMGKIPFQIKFGQEAKVDGDKVKALLQKAIYNAMDFTIIGSNNTYIRSEKILTFEFFDKEAYVRSSIDDDPKLLVFGTKSDWIDNEYLTFEYTFKLYLKDKGDYNFNNFTVNLPKFWKHSFFGIDTDNFEDFRANNIEFSISAYKDLNGDGIDDETGEIIPAQTDLDIDDGDWEHMSLLEKIEYLFTAIPNTLVNIFDSLLSGIKYAISCLGTIATSGSQISNIFTDIFSFMPAPIPELIKVLFFVMPFVALISWIKR